MEKVPIRNLKESSNTYKAAYYIVSRLYQMSGVDRGKPFMLTATGAENIPEDGPCILAYTHHHSWDTPAIGTLVFRRTLRPIYFMAKQELLDDEFRFGRLLKSMHAIPFTRGPASKEE